MSAVADTGGMQNEPTVQELIAALRSLGQSAMDEPELLAVRLRQTLDRFGIEVDTSRG